MALKKETSVATVSKPSAMQYIRPLYLSIAAGIGLICLIVGASGAIGLALNHWFPVDDFGYYSPYEKSPCNVSFVDGKEVARSADEIAKCEKQMEESRAKQNTNNFNREVKESVSLLIVGFPVWLLHFMLLQADWKRRKEI